MIKKSLICIYLTILCIFSLSCAKKMQGESPGGCVEGVILDRDSHSTLDSAKVSMSYTIEGLDETENIAYSDETGNYLLYSGFLTGKYYLKAEKQGFLAKIDSVTIVVDDTVTANFELRKE
jgi:hypothetical protein